MSEMKIPPDSSSVDKKFIPPSTPSPIPENLEETASTSPVKDSLEAFVIDDLPSNQKASMTPLLQAPETQNESLLAYFKTINSATLALRHQLQASDIADQESRRSSSQAAAEQSKALLELYNQRKEAIATLESEAKQAVEEMKKKLEQMQNETQQQQDRVNQINAGNAQEKEEYQKLNQAYEEYIHNLESIGAVDQGNGNYSIPEEAQDQYNTFTQQYQKAVDQFNGYWKERQAQINQYNSATIAYNQSALANNQYINNLINKYNLSDFLKKNGYTIPNQQGAGLRDLSGYANQIPAPSTINSTPAVISSYPLPPYTQSIGNSGPPSLTQLDSYTPIDVQKIYDGIYSNLYDSRITSLDQKIQTNYLFWSFWHRQALINHENETIADPFLNTKLLALRILPASFIESSMPIKPSENVGSSGIAMQAIGLNNSHLEDILGRSILKQALESFNLKTLEEKDAQFKEQKINQLTDQLLFLSIGLLGNQSLQALFPSLSLIGPSLESLPKDSPAFAILFAVSLANRIQEDAKQGITAETLQNFLKETPELANLTEEDQAQLTAILNLGQLLVASKLLETSLGLPGLLTQILPALSPALDSKALVSQAAQEGRQELNDLQAHLTDHFINEGYPKETAQFLAQVGTQLTEQGLLTPTATVVNYPQMINQPLLVDSVKAALVLADYPLTKADTIAHEAIDNTLLESPYRSMKQFRTALQAHLQDLGVSEKSSEIALQAVVIPAQEKSLAFLPPVSNTTTSQTAAPPRSKEAPAKKTTDTQLSKEIPSREAPANVPFKETPTNVPLTSVPLSPAQLIAILERRSLQLLTPQLGPQITKQVNEEIAKTLFGTANPDSRDIADVKSPYSLINVIKDQLHHLHIEQNKAWATTVSKTFKETIKTMESFYAFSLKLMDPAYLFVANTGIIYGNQGNKKPIDILI